ncbi:MAG: hypothetical protein K2Q21_14680 [Chitinophagaceae bacterium]|nr:hypothetical protein [Chitinophagaceae bacterium]
MPKLYLHEAIALVLLSKEDRKASIDEIADEINKRNLYKRKDENDVPAYQIMQRTKLSSGQYHHLFEWSEPNMVRLRNIELN